MTHRTRIALTAAVVAAMFVALLAPSPASAQTLYGSIVGTVADESGAPVPGATVVVTNSGTNAKAEATSDGSGDFAFRNLLPGNYDLTVSMQGFRELRQTGVRVSAGNPVRHDLKLQVGALAEAVTVVGEAATLQTEKSDLHTELTAKEVVNLPLNQFRNYQALLNLVPGATPAQFQNAEIDTPGRALRTNLNGSQPNSNTTRIDGAVSVNIWLPHHTGIVQSAETIETVNISTNNFDADQGMAAGGAITLVTKSGTNEFHGSAFVLRNQEEFNANTFANNAFGLEKSPLSNNIYGGTVGGPIVRNKLFFFGAWERYQARRGTNVTYSVPSLRMRNGDFGEVYAAYPNFRLFNPNTGGAGGVGRAEFPNGAIPSNLVSPTWRQLLNFYPEPNTSADLNGNRLPDDFVRPQTVKNDRDNFDLKLTWQRNGAHSIWSKFAMLDAEVVGGTSGEFVLGFDNGSLGDTRVYVGAIGHTWTLSPNLVLDGNIGMNRQDQEVTGPDYGENLGQQVLGIPGTNGTDIRSSGLPAFNIAAAPWASTTGIYDIGTTPNWMPLFRKERSYTFSSALTWVTGKHQIRGGLDIVRHELNHFQAEFGSFGGVRGGFEFRGTTTGVPGYAPQVWNELGALVLGLPSVRQKDVQEVEMTGREMQYGLYLTDRWHPTSKLTLNVGLRFEMYPLMRRADRGIERLDLATYEVLLGGLGNTPEDAGINVKKFYVAPRLGASYRLTDDTVLRAGYGRTFNPLPWSRPMRGSFPYDIFFNQTAEQFNSFRLQDGIPAVPVPDLSSGRVKLPPSTFIRTPEPDNVDRATIQQMNLAVEQRLPWDLSLEVAYVHTRTDGGYADRDINHSEPGAGQAGRKFFSLAGSTAINSWGSRTKSRYHGLQLGLNRPFRNGLLLKGAYTLSRSQNEADEDGWVGLTYNHPALLDRNFTLAGFDRTHVFQMGFVYELPFARGSKSVLGRVVQGWQVNGIGSAYSGTPFSVTGTNTAVNCPGCGTVFINVNGDPKPTGTPGSSTEPWYDKSVFSQPTGANFEGFGNSERNQFRSPAVWNVDLGIFRSFQMGRVRPEIRIEASNVFNHTNWARPNLTFTSPQFMTFNAAAAHQFNNTWGTATRERTVQIGLRLEF